MWFYREDLHLENKWRHRLLKILFYWIMIIALIILFLIFQPNKFVLDNKQYIKITSTIKDKEIPTKEKMRVNIVDLKSGNERFTNTCWSHKKWDIIELDNTFYNAAMFYEENITYCKKERTKENLEALSKIFNNANYVDRYDWHISSTNEMYKSHSFWWNDFYPCFRYTQHFSDKYWDLLVNEYLWKTDNSIMQCFYTPTEKSHIWEYVSYWMKWLWCLLKTIFWLFIIWWVLLLTYYKWIVYIICWNPKKKGGKD